MLVLRFFAFYQMTPLRAPRSVGFMSDAKLFANRSALFANDAESAMIACSLL
jgi:hypothetical protein